MKNIYEDSNRHDSNEDIMSSSYGNGSENAPSFKQNGSDASASNVPALQLTPEQISALVAQLVTSRDGTVSNAEANEQAKEEDKASEQAHVNPGKKILFQSDDFEEKEEPVKFPKYESKEDSLADIFDEKEEVKQKPSKSSFRVFDVSEDGERIEVSSFETKQSKEERYETPVPAGSSISVEPMGDDDDEPFKPKKEKLSKGEIIRRSVLAVSLIAIVIASAVLLHEYKLSKDNKEFEAGVSNLIIDVPETTKPSKNEKPDKEAELSIEQQWNDIIRENPNVIFPPKMQLKYAKLFAKNQDFVGYLQADGINLSLPVVQTSDDSTYLEKNFEGEKTKYGCPFVSYLNNIQTLDQNTVIFGHHMNDKTIFGALDNYKTVEGYRKAPIITFNTLYKDCKWKVIAAFITNAEPEDDDNYVFQYYFTQLNSRENFADYLDEIKVRSLYSTDVEVNSYDRLLTLSTCSHEFENGRFVVVARLVRPGESLKVDTDKAEKNASPRYPQAYYSKTKTANPYKDTSKWYIN